MFITNKNLKNNNNNNNPCYWNTIENKIKLTSSIRFTPKCLSSGLMLYKPVLHSTDKSTGFEMSIRFKSIIFCNVVNDSGGYCLLTLKKVKF